MDPNIAGAPQQAPMNIAGPPQQAPMNIAPPENVARQQGLESRLQQVQAKYPAFKNIPAKITSGPGNGYLEYYSPKEGRNPNPGKVTLEMRPLSSSVDEPFLQSLIAGDLTHYLGDMDEAGKPYDPKFYELKQQFGKTLTPDQHAISKQQFADYKQNGDINPDMTYEEFLNHSSIDMWMRGYLFPDPDNEFKQPGKGEYTLKQIQLLQKARKYIEGTR